MLLRFRVSNHGSIRDEQTLSLVLPSVKTGAPPDGDWYSHTTRVAGIYGPNASGKSTVLKAIRFLDDAVSQSFRAWSERKSFPHIKFLLEEGYHDKPSLYEVDFLYESVRYSYGFEAGHDGILEEWLYSFPAARPRLLFKREGHLLNFGRSLQGDNKRIGKLLGRNTLYLSLAAALDHAQLTPLAERLTAGIMYADYGDPDRNARIQWIRHHLERDEDLRRKTIALLRVADLGVSGIELVENDLDDSMRRQLREMYESARAGSRESDGDDDDEDDDGFESVVESYRKQLNLMHKSTTSSREVRFSLRNESDGTIAWLSLLVPALWAMKRGNTFLIDEIDASLHPRLTATLISMFRDKELNPGGGQLIFTSHDSTLLGSLAGEPMAPHEVWFTEKDAGGATSLYSLEEFVVRKQDNIERRYLQGRYGAIPIVSAEDVKTALLDVANA